MYVKIARYGQKAQEQIGNVAGAICVEVLPQGELSHHIELEIIESHDLGKYPEPMVRISVDHNKASMFPLSVLLQPVIGNNPNVIGETPLN